MGDVQAGDGGRNTAGHVEDAAGMVTINDQVIRTGTVEGDILVHEQFASRQSNGAGDSEVDRVTVMGVRDRLSQ